MLFFDMRSIFFFALSLAPAEQEMLCARIKNPRNPPKVVSPKELFETKVEKLILVLFRVKREKKYKGILLHFFNEASEEKMFSLVFSTSVLSRTRRAPLASFFDNTTHLCLVFFFNEFPWTCKIEVSEFLC